MQHARVSIINIGDKNMVAILGLFYWLLQKFSSGYLQRDCQEKVGFENNVVSHHKDRENFEANSGLMDSHDLEALDGENKEIEAEDLADVGKKENCQVNESFSNRCTDFPAMLEENNENKARVLKTDHYEDCGIVAEIVLDNLKELVTARNIAALSHYCDLFDTHKSITDEDEINENPDMVAENCTELVDIIKEEIMVKRPIKRGKKMTSPEVKLNRAYQLRAEHIRRKLNNYSFGL